MVERDPTRAKELQESLDIALKDHADEIYRQDRSNLTGARILRLQALDVRELIEIKSGAVRNMAISWLKEIQPIAKIVFGEELDEESIGASQEYRPTVFDGIFGRARLLIPDGQNGPAVAIDLAAHDSVQNEPW